jgi:hypothetical protein
METPKQNMLSVITVSFSNMMNHFCHENSVIKTVACEESHCSHPFILRSEFVTLPMMYIIEQQDFSQILYNTEHKLYIWTFIHDQDPSSLVYQSLSESDEPWSEFVTKGKIQDMWEVIRYSSIIRDQFLQIIQVHQLETDVSLTCAFTIKELVTFCSKTQQMSINLTNKILQQEFPFVQFGSNMTGTDYFLKTIIAKHLLTHVSLQRTPLRSQHLLDRKSVV